MLKIYNIIHDNKNKIISTMLNTVPKKITSYRKTSKPELKESLERFLNAYSDLLITGSNKSLEQYYNYIIRRRVAQSFKVGSIAKAALCFTSVLSKYIETTLPADSEDDKNQINKLKYYIEDSIHDVAALIIDLSFAYSKELFNKQQDFIKEEGKDIDVDLSKFVLFKG